MPDARVVDAYLFGLTSASAPLREESRKALEAIAPAALPAVEERLAAGTLPPAAHAPLRRLYLKVPEAAQSPLLTRPVKEVTPAEYFDSAMKTRGDARRGRALFEDRQGVACVKCHTAGAANQTTGPGGDLGPNLSTIGEQYGREHLAESILDPSKVV